MDAIKKAAEALFTDGATTEEIIALIKAVLGVIFGFIADEEGYDYPAAE